ncbi:MAG: gas vesicle protein GvpG [Burkholderiales bacterium]|nr:gas vesicle protein GvpG [Burkholderiales bacterium]
MLLAPFKGLLWIFREVHKIAQEEVAQEAESITHRLSELYTLLETGQITEEEFTAEETKLLDRLDEIRDDQEWE